MGRRRPAEVQTGSGSSFAQIFLPNRELVMSSPSEPPGRDPLQNLLEDAETELHRRLEEACEAEAKGLATESTEEIRRLEDTLLAAAMAAKQTVAVRRHIRRRNSAERERPIKVDVEKDRGAARTGSEKKPESTVGGRSENNDMGVREFTDDMGRPWRAWPVIPGQSRASSSGRQFLGDFQDGWICFEGLGTSARRRLPCRQSTLANVSDEELQRLLQQSIDAPVRPKKQQE
jgi:hypothetical protein